MSTTPNRNNAAGQDVNGAGPAIRHVRYRDLSVENPALKLELLAAVDRVLTHGQILLGPEVEQLEEEIARYCGVDHCVGVASGTDALYVALRCIGVGPGDEVITTPLSWVATLNAIHICGATPVFVDIKDDLNIDASLIEAAITPRTKAIVPVHFTGRLCNMAAICEVASRHGVLVIEDAAQAFGANISGVYAGGFGDLATFSFNPMKVLPSYGEAGAVLAKRRDWYDKLIALRYLGTVDKEYCLYPSLNAKIDTIQAAMLLVNLKYVDDIISRRIEIARYYSEALGESVGCPTVSQGPDRPSVFFDYTITVDRRDAVQAHLESRGIETKIKHPILMPHQPGYSHLARPNVPVAETAVKRILSIPIHEKMSDAEVEFVADTVKSVQ